MKITDNFFKKSKQRNVQINKSYYNGKQWQTLQNWDKTFMSHSNTGLRIALAYVKEIKVVVDEFGYLTTKAILKSDEFGFDITELYVEI